MTRLMEQYSRIKFVMSSQRQYKISTNLASHAFFIKLAFPKANINKLVPNFLSDNILVAISNCNSSDDNEPTKMVQYLHNMLKAIKKERNILNVAMKIREMCYKLYHLNIKLAYICRLVIDYYKESKHLLDIIGLCADSEHATLIGTKDLLVYEGFFLRLYKIMKR